jgi:DNA-binding transcriptional MerR regulator
MGTNDQCEFAASPKPGERGNQAVYSIGDLAADLGVSPRGIYTQRDLARLKLILRGKRLGFSLSDIRKLLDLYDVDRDHLEQMHQTLAKGRARIAELEQQLVELQMTLHELRELETLLVHTINQRTSGTKNRRTGNAEELPTS